MFDINNKKKIIFIVASNLILISVLFSYDLLNYYPIYPTELFEDWLYIYDYKDCKFSIILNQNQCSKIITNNFVYPEIWLNLANFFENRLNFSNIIYPIILIHVLITSLYLSKFPTFVNFIFTLSPVSILLIHRANNDLIIFFLIFIFNFLIISNKFKFFSIIPLIIAIKAKIYPLSLIPVFILIYKNSKKVNFFLYLLFILFFTILLIYYSELFKFTNFYNKSGATLSFSSSLIFKIFSFLTSINVNYNLLSICILIFLIFISIFSKKNIPLNNFKIEISFLIGSSIIVSSFFLNEGFVYKLIFLIFTLPLIFEYKNKGYNKLHSYLLIISFSALWVEYLSFWVENILNINNFHPKLFPGLNFNNIIYGISIIFKNIIYWILNLNLIFISSKIFLRRFCSKL